MTPTVLTAPTGLGETLPLRDVRPAGERGIGPASVMRPPGQRLADRQRV
ncbi:hypothetical protein RM190_10210 [Paracoccus sp. CPCC 101403]|uniref:Uncharacterized protein n=1 Tax=Paracoccus broussonetiae TaxID=3075834 RepID=A0ABU3EDB6_9RHOB|nr:hypothetical protein [Paracoccus sp. CPCC 101403]MDT1062233.1 hypothetical protein [Paracoccus sp. CPCC 101403]